MTYVVLNDGQTQWVADRKALVEGVNYLGYRRQT
jgi:hypothetical protein